MVINRLTSLVTNLKISGFAFPLWYYMFIHQSLFGEVFSSNLKDLISAKVKHLTFLVL